MEIFRSIDVKNRGFLTSADFRRLCLDLDVGLTAGQIVWAFGQLDADHDGQISGDDFVRGHRAFTELFIAGVTSQEDGERLDDVTGVMSDGGGGGGVAAWKRFVERYEVELALLPSVRLYTLTHSAELDPTSCAGGRHNMPPPPCKLTFDLSTSKAVSESSVAWAISV